MTTTTSAAVTSTDRSPFPHPEPAGEGWARPAAVAGIAFVVLNVAGTFAPGAPPASDASAAKVAAYFEGHSGAIKAQLLIGCVGIAALLWWFGALWRVMSRAEAERPRLAVVAAVGLGLGLTLAMMSAVCNSTVAIRVERADVTALFYGMSFVAVAAANFGIGTFLLATCILMYRTQFAPRWLSYLGVLAGLVFYVGGIGTATSSSVINTFGVVAFLMWCVWIVAMSAYLWRGDLTARA